MKITANASDKQRELLGEYEGLCWSNGMDLIQVNG